MTDYHVIDTVEELHVAIDRLAGGSGPIAVDAERASGFRYSQRAYLIQLFRRDAGTFLIDPPAVGRLDGLSEAIAGEEWVLHAASQDLACLREVGLNPTTIFDTELGARLLGLPKVGLGTVVEELLGVHLAKEHSAADWSTRPLPQPWLVYAALDVELLVDLRDAIEAMLRNAQKEQIARAEFLAELNRPAKQPKAEPWRRLSGVHSIKGARPLAVARSLWYARDELARQLDVSPGRLVPDASLTAAALAMPSTRAELGALKQFSGRASRTELDRWWAAIERGRHTDDLPMLKPHGEGLAPARVWKDRNPAAAARLHAAREAMAVLSAEQKIPVENLLLPEALRKLAWEPPQPITAASIADGLRELDAREWQIELASAAIAAVFVEADQTTAGGDEAVSSEASHE